MAKTIFNFFVGPSPPKRKKKHAIFNWRFGLPCLKKGSMVEVTLTNEQKVMATIAPVTLKGKPVEIDGAAMWQVATGDCTLADISEDGKSATIVTGDAPGTSEVVVSADADLGEGVETISDVITVTVQGAKAASLGLTLGEPELK